jgi:hypothetical protein
MSPARVRLLYVGPPLAESPEVGPLEPGQGYEWPAELAEYLVRQHPDHWQRPPAARAAATPTFSTQE